MTSLTKQQAQIKTLQNKVTNYAKSMLEAHDAEAVAKFVWNRYGIFTSVSKNADGTHTLKLYQGFDKPTFAEIQAK